MSDQEQPGVNIEAAALPDNQSQSGGETGEQMIPLSALQAERRERQQLQEQTKLLQDHMQLLQANMQQQQEKPKDEFDGLTDNDVLTVGEAKKFINSFSQQQNLQIEELKMIQSHPDYNEVVREHLPEVLKTDPEMERMIRSSQNPYKAAYLLAKKSDGYMKEKMEKARTPEARQAQENLQHAGNLSSVGQAASSSAASSYKAMSDTDFTKLVNRNLGYI